MSTPGNVDAGLKMHAWMMGSKEAAREARPDTDPSNGEGAGAAPNTAGHDAEAEGGDVAIVAVDQFEPSEPAPPEEASVYRYRDFATLPVPTGTALHPRSLQAQKLPAKLAAILSDPDLLPMVRWLPHGRSWRVLSRDLFAEYALPRYFGHKNYASFVRIVNAWGFRRVAHGPDRDAYYNELFLRGRPDLHQRMKRYSACHSKTPANKDDKSPNFYELAKTSPLPDLEVVRPIPAPVGGLVSEPKLRPAVGHAGVAPLFPGPAAAAVPVPGAPVTSLGPLLERQMGNVNEQVLSLLGNNPTVHQSLTHNLQHSSLSRLAQLENEDRRRGQLARENEERKRVQLERENEDLKRRVLALESQQRPGGNPRAVIQQHAAAPDPFAALGVGLGGDGRNQMLQREIGQLQRDFMLQHSTASMGIPMNNSLNNPVTNSLLPPLGGVVAATRTMSPSNLNAAPWHGSR